MDGRLPGVDDDSPEQVICHVDMDCFYAACERLREPALRGEPLVVGMGYESGETHGAVATATYEAREFGVESAMPISQALELLPRRIDAVDDPEVDPSEAGFYRTVDMEYYESVASEVKSVLHDTADTVREVSIDEAYLDVTGTVDWGEAAAFGQTLRDRIEKTVGVVASVGIAPAMSAAKIASDHDKPDGLVVVRPGEVREFLAPLDVEEVHNVGPVTARELRSMGVETAGDLADADPERLEDRFGGRGREIWSYARGEDDRIVEPVGKPKSLSRESAFTEATDDIERKRERVRALAGDVAERAKREDALYRTIGIKIVTPPFEVNTRAESLPGPVEDAGLVAEVALELLKEFRDADVRKIGVRVSNLDFSNAQQASLDGFEGDDSGATSVRENYSLGEFLATQDDERDDADPRGQTSLSEFEE
ncbi:DNA polymerase IV [Halorientalis sp.]|uniref:DNA polymerase IV n=1 Tax=Halorientalis sp. TaxID=1931229 RepID=UPI0026117063|nr:DNA polymerase IV [Halorientalis sp.]